MPHSGAKPPSGETPKKALLAAMTVTEDPTRPHRANPLHLSAFHLAQQPNGGNGRILIRVRPHALPEEAPTTDLGTVYVSDEEMAAGVGEGLTLPPPLHGQRPFWYRTNEGDIRCFDIDYTRLKAQYGVSHGERVLSTWGPTAGSSATVVGARGGCLWVREDGAAGATALFGLATREAITHALGWVSSGSCYVEPATTVTVPVLSADKSAVELRTLAVDPQTMALCFGKGIVHGSIHVVTALPYEDANRDDALLFIPVGVDTTNGDLVAFFVNRSQSDVSATMMGGVGGGRGAGPLPAGDETGEALLQALLFAPPRTFALNRSAVTPSLVFAHVLEGVQNPQGVAALLRPERLVGDVGAGAAPATAAALSQRRRAEAAAPLLHPAAKLYSSEGHGGFMAFKGAPLPVAVFATPDTSALVASGIALPRHAHLAVRQPSVQFRYKPNTGRRL